MKNWNSKILVVFAFVLTSSLYAQGPVQERIRTLKVGFITERLGLTSEEAQSFWPVYNAYDESLQKLRRKERQRFGSQLPFLQDLSEIETSKLLTEYSAIQKEKFNLEQKFITDLKSVLPSKKIVLLLKAEEDFKKRLLQQVRKRRGQ